MTRPLDVAAVWGLRAAALLLLIFAPRRRLTARPGRVASLFLRPPPRRTRFPAEADVARVGLAVATLDPLMSRRHARELRAAVRPLLAEMDANPDYAAVAPAYPLAATGHPDGPDHGHLFAFAPATAPGERLGLLAVLHGHGGNTLLLLHFWREWAERHRFAVALPSFGYGNWEHPHVPACVVRCVEAMIERYPVDGDRVWLAGVSQGGAGLAPAAAAMPGRVRGVIYLSGTMEPGRVAAGVPAFVAQGERDHNVTPNSVRRGVAALRGAGCDVTEFWDADADHFLMFTRREELLRRLTEWLTRRPPAAPTPPAGAPPNSLPRRGAGARA